jgi:hypothetical protein
VGGDIGWGPWERLPRRLYSPPWSLNRPALAERSTADRLLDHRASGVWELQAHEVVRLVSKVGGLMFLFTSRSRGDRSVTRNP